jgi:hypothetical protein
VKRSSLVVGFSVAASLLAVLGAGERDARACGGCFHPPTQVASDITDERMLLAVSPKQTSLYDQIRYAGNPSSFAWVLPIKETVDVGLSADVLFSSMDALTATQITPPPKSCAGPPASCQSPLPPAENAAVAGGASDSTGGVTVTKQENVGPYATVQLHSTTPGALTQWLADNGFQIPDAVKPIIEQYVGEGFDFLAMKLLPNQGVQAMRPVRVTGGGASFSLPLRMAAIGTGVSVGITIWVLADGRYQPQNFPFYRIEDKDLVWDWSTNASNYTTLRAQNESNLGGKGWELESSITLNQGLITSVIESGGIYYRGGGFSGAPISNASDDYLEAPASGATAAQSADQVRAADVAALFAGMAGPNVRVTRMRSDISHAAMTTDFVLQAAPDQSELSNVRTVSQWVNLYCPVYMGCKVVGTVLVPSPGPAGAAAPTSGGGGSCAATAPKTSFSDVGLTTAGALALAALVRARMRRARKGAHARANERGR